MKELCLLLLQLLLLLSMDEFDPQELTVSSGTYSSHLRKRCEVIEIIFFHEITDLIMLVNDIGMHDR